MFSNRIGNSAKFLQMPTEAQNLYFHMILRADDDGVVESYPLVKLLGIPPDNFKVLIAKGFIKQLNEDQVIVIVDWLEHNSIRADRKVDSIYKNLLLEKAPEIPLIEPKARIDVKDNSKRLGGQSTVSISQVKLSQGKVSIVAKSDEVFSFKEELEILEVGGKNKNRKDYKIIAFYWIHKGWTFENREQFNSALKRELRPAKALLGYSRQQIDRTIDFCKNKYEEWTLESVGKKINEVNK